MGIYRSTLRHFGRLGTKYLKSYVDPLRQEIVKSNLNMIFELYVGRMLFMSFLAFLISFAATTIYISLTGINLIFSLASGLIIGITSFVIVLTLYHSYPYQQLSSKKSDIDSNMPFAINHMSAIA